MSTVTKKVAKIVEKKNLWFLISTLIIVCGVGVMTSRTLQTKPALNMGIDFVGGSTFLLDFGNSHSSESQRRQLIQSTREILSTIGFEGSQIQLTPDGEMILKTTAITPESVQSVQQTLESQLSNFTILEIDFIGPTIGHELRRSAFWIIGSVSLLLLIYISWRFELIYGVSALVALFHDALVTICISALLFIEINTAFVAAILTILGYSINDTIVIFDRIRENSRHKEFRTLPFETIINHSILQTMLRTINTSITTLGVIGFLYFFGGITLADFSRVLLIGIMSGTYSSLCIASPVLWQLRQRV